jgi:hypothetical protein
MYSGKSGWPPRTIMDKMIKEGIVGSATSRFIQYHPECLGEEELVTNNAVKRLAERDRELLFIVYVVAERPKMIMRFYSIERTPYYDWIDNVHKRLSESLFLKPEQNSENCRQSPTSDFANVVRA